MQITIAKPAAQVEVQWKDGEIDSLQFGKIELARTYCRNQSRNPNVITATLKEIKK